MTANPSWSSKLWLVSGCALMAEVLSNQYVVLVFAKKSSGGGVIAWKKRSPLPKAALCFLYLILFARRGSRLRRQTAYLAAAICSITLRRGSLEMLVSPLKG